MRAIQKCYKSSLMSRGRINYLDQQKMHFSEPIVPVSFAANDFTIRRSEDEMILRAKNFFDMDSRIKFDESSHKYLIDDKPAVKSVTELVSSVFESFEPDLVIEKMMTGPKWPRDEYKWPNGDVMTPEQIKKKWEGYGNYARNQGTWMHYNIERYFNGLTPSPNVLEMEQLYAFEKDVLVRNQIRPFRTEWQIAAPELMIAGTIDFVGKKPDGKYVLVDWKRSLKLPKSIFNHFGKTAKPPFEHLDDHDGSKYFLQLNVYKYILVEFYGIEVTQMLLVSLHPKLPEYYKISVPDMRNEVVALLYNSPKSAS